MRIEEYFRQLQSWTDVWGEERRLLEYSSISRRRRKEVRRCREELCSEWTGEHLQGRYKNNLCTFGLQPGVIEENNRAEKKLEEEPQDEDSYSQATTRLAIPRCGQLLLLLAIPRCGKLLLPLAIPRCSKLLLLLATGVETCKCRLTNASAANYLPIYANVRSVQM